VQDRAAEAIETGDLQRVAVAQDPRDLVELGTAGFGAAGVVEVDVVRVDAGAFERVDLVVGILVSGRDSRVAEQQAVENPGWAEIFVVVSRRGLSTLLAGNRCRGLECRQMTVSRQPAHGLPPREPGRDRAWGAFSEAAPPGIWDRLRTPGAPTAPDPKGERSGSRFWRTAGTSASTERDPHSCSCGRGSPVRLRGRVYRREAARTGWMGELTLPMRLIHPAFAGFGARRGAG
jgi:hypothetical protein